MAVELCASGMTIPERTRALLDALPTLQAAEAAYKGFGLAGTLHQIPSSDGVTPQLTTELMGIIYKAHFMRSGSPSRVLYDAIRSAPKHGICPLCGQRIVASVDHYLPQSLHPAFNLTPANLVPACADCNKNKLAHLATDADRQTLHPYFDDLGTARWLVADIQENWPPGITYRVRPPADWTPVLGKRVSHHFELMGLAALYAAQAASELADISYSLLQAGTTGGGIAVRAHLYGEYKSRHARDANSWKTALYEALCDSNWFCTDGYRSLR